MARILLSSVVLFGLLMTLHAWAPGPAAKQEETLPERVARLEREAARLREDLAEQIEARLGLDARVKAIEAWMGKFPAASQAFDRSLDQVLDQGFTYAAPNLHSRETLIKGLRDLGRSLSPKAPGDSK